MPLIQFIGLAGLLFGVESLATAIVGALVLLLGTAVLRAADKAGARTGPSNLHWLVIALKAVGLWSVATLMLAAASHYAGKNAWLFWLCSIIGAMLLCLFKADVMLRHDKSMQRKLQSLSGYELILATVTHQRLVIHESILNSIALVYMLTAAAVPSLHAFSWAVAVIQKSTTQLSTHQVVAFLLFGLGWLVVARYMLAIGITIPSLALLLTSRRGKTDAPSPPTPHETTVP